MVQPVHVVIRGVPYPSLVAAARAHGVKPSTVYSALERGTLDRVGSGKSRHNLVPVKVNGKAYEGAAFAARAYGVNPHSLRGAIQRARAKGQTRAYHPQIGVVTW